jgi:hypothetical protein
MLAQCSSASFGYHTLRALIGGLSAGENLLSVAGSSEEPWTMGVTGSRSGPEIGSTATERIVNCFKNIVSDMTCYSGEKRKSFEQLRS